MHVCMQIFTTVNSSQSSRISSNERVIVVSFLSVCENNIWELTPIQHFWLQIKIYCNTLSSLVLICSSYFPAVRFSSLSHLIVSVQSQRMSIYMHVFILHYFYPFNNIIQSYNRLCWLNNRSMLNWPKSYVHPTPISSQVDVISGSKGRNFTSINMRYLNLGYGLRVSFFINFVCVLHIDILVEVWQWPRELCKCTCPGERTGLYITKFWTISHLASDYLL